MLRFYHHLFAVFKIITCLKGQFFFIKGSLFCLVSLICFDYSGKRNKTFSILIYPSVIIHKYHLVPDTDFSSS